MNIDGQDGRVEIQIVPGAQPPGTTSESLQRKRDVI